MWSLDLVQITEKSVSNHRGSCRRDWMVTVGIKLIKVVAGIFGSHRHFGIKSRLLSFNNQDLWWG
uniref:Uncharacterized protein n=1 Tax=Octopus bimaculoides TaxID=37653 RepID=A0A0L8HEI5_OCTBM